MQKIIYTALFTLGVFAVVATPAFAEVLGEQSQSQKAEQEVEATCIGSYGQETTCKIKASQKLEQEQRQKILAATTVARGNRVHTPVDTALDGTTMAAALGLATIGGLSYAAKRKIA